MARKNSRKEGSGRTILLVDDSPEILDSTRSLLEFEGHTVHSADNGPDALEILRHQDIELLLVDYFMPGMTGEEVVNELRKFNRQVQVVLQTGYSSERPPREMLARLDIQGYCDKSEGPEHLLLWVDVGLKFAKQVRTLEMSRQGLRYILDVTPDLHRIQPLEELLQGILLQIAGLVGAVNSFVAVKPESIRKATESDAFLAMVEEERELVIHAGIGRFEGESRVENVLTDPQAEDIRESMRQGSVLRNSRATSVPLRIGASTIGVIFLDNAPDIPPENIEMLHVFANQAAVAVQNAQLYQMATLDPLTGVYARKFWEQMALREIRTSFRFRNPATVVVFDLDRFKNINDEHGHLVGDKALEMVGRILRASSRSSDAIGRFGGDEFVAILPRTAQDGASVFCNRVLREMERQDLSSPNGTCLLRSSIGIATLVPHEFEMNTIPRPIPNAYFQHVLRTAFFRADRQVYVSKKSGGHRFHIDSDTDWPDPRDPASFPESTFQSSILVQEDP